jgi:hypothetical protein
LTQDSRDRGSGEIPAISKYRCEFAKPEVIVSVYGVGPVFALPGRCSYANLETDKPAAVRVSPSWHVRRTFSNEEIP